MRNAGVAAAVAVLVAAVWMASDPGPPAAGVPEIPAPSEPAAAPRFTDAAPVSESPLFDDIGSLAVGGTIDLPLPGNETTPGRLRYVHTHPNGATAAGGRLEDGGGIFEIAREPWGYRGFILRQKEGVAFVYGTDPDGRLTVARRPSGEVICEPDPHWKPIAGNEGPDPQRAAIYHGGRSVGILYERIPILSSLPRAAATIYLDFDGEVIEGHAWEGGARIVAPAFNLPASEVTSMWRRVAEDFAPFEVNVTTDLQTYLRAPQGLRIRCITTSNNFANAGGVAFNNTFRQSGEPVCWNFVRGDAGADVISHEVGHTFGLHHDGQGTNGYYTGHGSGATSWGPIMGAPYGRAVTHWSKGDYAGANQPQNDLLIIGASVPRRMDDCPESAETAHPLMPGANGSVNETGLIASPDDIDRYIFRTGGGVLDLQFHPAPEGPNLRIEAKLHDSAGTHVATAGPDNRLSASIPADTYTITVDGIGNGTWATNGYDDYGSLGAYTIAGAIPAPGWIFQVPANALAGAVAGTVAANGTAYTITRGNTGGAFAIDASNGRITVANPAALTEDARFDLTVSHTVNGVPANAAATVRVAPVRGLKREIWTGLGGSGVAGLTSSPKYPNHPDQVTHAPTFQGVIPADNYGQKFSGHLVPAETGTHIFSTTSDDASQLWLSPDENPANAVPIVANNSAAAPDDDSKRSAPVPLVAGQKYYIELLHREHFGGDHAGVFWQTPTQPMRLIASDFLRHPGTPPNRAPWLASRTFRIREDSAPGTAVGTLDAGDHEAGSTLSGFTITGGNDGNTFLLDAATGSLTVNGPLSFAHAPKFLLDVRVTDSGGLTTHAQIAVEIEALAVKREFWAGIGGEAVGDLTSSPAFPNHPTSIAYLPFFEAPANAGSDYGQRLSGWLRAPDTGDYTFWIASDDQGELWLSSDEDPANKVRIAYQGSYTNPRQWDKHPGQKSAPVTLVGGRFYHIEALQKEAAGGDHLAVAWQGPDFGRVILGAPHVTQSFYNHGAPVLANASATIMNVPTGSPFLTLEAKDWADPGTTVTYHIAAGNDDGAFAIDPVTGALRLIASGTSAGTRVLTITATDNGPIPLSGSATVTIQVLRAAMKREVWRGVPGLTHVSDLTSMVSFPGHPEETGATVEFRAPTNDGDGYGQRLSAFLVPPVSGNYTFWIASDDSGELWISTDMSAANKVKRCEVSGFVSELNWDAQPGQKSAVIPLVGGQRYYVEALQRDGIGGDHLAVAWQGPNIARSVIGATHLLYPDFHRPALKREVWTGIAGLDVASLVAHPAFPNSPDEVTQLEAFEAPANTGDNYGQKISGYLVAPSTGDYRFWIASDDGSELWLAGDGNPANASRIAQADAATGNRNWDQFPSQMSPVVRLTAGQRCYIAALMKEGPVADHLSVAWEGPGFSRRIIGNAYLEHPDAPADRGLPRRELWHGIEGERLTDLTSSAAFPGSPSVTGTLAPDAGFVAGTDIAENYGQRISAYLVAPASGHYTFWIASDDFSELRISTDENPANLVRRAGVDGYVNPQDWDARPEQKSAPIPLEAGRRYRIEALHKEGRHGDHLAVAWEGPGFSRQTIRSTYLEHPLSIPGTPSIRREVWSGIGGERVSDLTTAPDFGTPDSRGLLTAFEAPPNQGDSYGQRISARLVAPETGNYRFWIASDDDGELWISPDDDPAGRVRIAATGVTGFREWTANASQVSGHLPLVAGRSYHIEALQKEGGGLDHLSVAWEGPSFGRRILDGRFLADPGAFQDGSPADPAPFETGYLFWLDAAGLQGSDRFPTADPNRNGIPNAIEYVLGGGPDMLPTATYDGNWAVFEFRRSRASAASVPAVEFGTALDDWTTATDGRDDVSIATEHDGFGPGIDRVSVRIPKRSPRLFMRLRADVSARETAPP